MASPILDALAILAETPVRRIAPPRSMPSPTTVASNASGSSVVRPPPPPLPTMTLARRRRLRHRSRSTSPITRDRTPRARRRSLSPSSRVIPAPLSARRTVGALRRFSRRFFSNHPLTRSHISDKIPGIMRSTRTNTHRNTMPPPRGKRIPYVRRPAPGLTDRNHGGGKETKNRGVMFADDVSLVRYIIDEEEDEDRLVSSERIPLRGGGGGRRNPRRIRAPPPHSPPALLGQVEEQD